MDIASLICGIEGLVLSCLGIGIIPSIIAIVLGAKYNSTYGRDTKAIVGIVLGSIGTLIAIIIICAMAGGSKDSADKENVTDKKVEVIAEQQESELAVDKSVEDKQTATKKEESKEVVREESPEEKLLKNATTSQKNAYKSAKSYLGYSAFSYKGLIKQLEYEKYSTEDATWAADNCGADWYEQAVKQAKSYLDYSAFSHDGLIKQLEYEGFTTDEATKAADTIFGSSTTGDSSDSEGSGSVSKDNALRSAKSYLDYSAFSHKGLVKQLEYEGYSTEDATYAADNCGADWNEQAAKAAKSYLDYSAFSRDGLIEQLVYEGYTNEQAVFGVDSVGL